LNKCVCIILNYNDAAETIRLLDKICSFACFTGIVVVDNHSSDNSYSVLKQYESKKIKVIQTDKNGGYGYGNNCGIRYAAENMDADYFLICNPDVLFDETLVYRLIKVMTDNPVCGAVSAVQTDINGNEVIQSAWKIPDKKRYIASIGKIGWHFMSGYYYGLDCLHQNKEVKVDCIAGSLLLLSREAFEKTGGYDENIFLYCEETVLGCKLKKAGLHTYICSDITYQHLHGITIKKSFRSEYRRKKLLCDSHHYTLRHWLNGSAIELAADRVMIWIALAEEAILGVIRKN